MTIIYYYKENLKDEDKVILDVLKDEDFIEAKKNDFKKYKDEQPSEHFDKNNLMRMFDEDEDDSLPKEYITEKYAIYAEVHDKEYVIIPSEDIPDKQN